MLEPLLTQYRKKVGELGAKLSCYSSTTLAGDLIGKKELTADDINVIEFGRKRIEELKKAGREGSAKNMLKILYSLIDYFGTEDIRITDIRANMLKKYEDFLRNPRTQIRPDQFNRPRTREIAGMATNGVHNSMRDLRILFNCIREFYNDEDEGVMIVKHYPFRKYKLAYGIKKIGKALGYKNPEFYNARHAFGDLARNRCRFSMDDVGLAMNHKDNSNRVTDVYVSKN